MTVNSLAPIRTFLPIGSMFGKSDWYGFCPSTTTWRRCSTSVGVNSRPSSQLDEVDGGEVLGRAEDRDLGASSRGRSRRASGRCRRRPARRRPRAIDGRARATARASSRVMFGRLATSMKRLARREAEGAELLDEDGVRAERADRVAQRLVEAADQRRHADDRRDADDHAEHRQRRAHLAGAQRVDRHRHDLAQQSGCASPPWLLAPQRFDRVEPCRRASPDTGRRTGRRPR